MITSAEGSVHDYFRGAEQSFFSFLKLSLLSSPQLLLRLKVFNRLPAHYLALPQPVTGEQRLHPMRLPRRDHHAVVGSAPSPFPLWS